MSVAGVLRASAQSLLRGSVRPVGGDGAVACPLRNDPIDASECRSCFWRRSTSREAGIRCDPPSRPVLAYLRVFTGLSVGREGIDPH